MVDAYRGDNGIIPTRNVETIDRVFVWWRREPPSRTTVPYPLSTHARRDETDRPRKLRNEPSPGLRALRSPNSPEPCGPRLHFRGGELSMSRDQLSTILSAPAKHISLGCTYTFTGLTDCNPAFIGATWNSSGPRQRVAAAGLSLVQTSPAMRVLPFQ